MRCNLNKFIALSAALVITVPMSTASAFAVDFDTPNDSINIIQENRLSMPYDADVAFASPEFKSLIGQDVEDLTDLSPVAGYSAIKESIEISEDSDSLPQSFDMRDNGLINSVKSQGKYGICWTFSGSASAETSLLDTIPWIDLSEWHAGYYPYTGGDQIDIDADTISQHFDYGGNVNVLTNLWAQWIGPVTEEKMPYGDETFFDDPKTVAKFSDESDYHLENAYLFDYDDDNDNRESINSLVKQFIYDGHAVDVSFSTSGYSYETKSCYSTIKPKYANHSVTIAGWDDNYTASNFDGHTGAWLCRNSWDLNFGNDGYFWISYDDTSLCEFGVFNISSTEDYDVNYQHDSFIPTQTMSAYDERDINKPSYMANVFTAEDDSQLEAVSTYINHPGTEYEITIYTNLKDPSVPSSGTASSTTCGSSDLTGYITIELDEDVPLKAGEKFAVSVKMYCGDSPYVIPLETAMFLESPDTGSKIQLGRYTTYDKICSYTGRNESFYSENGIEWTDVADENFEYTEEEKNEILEQVIRENDDMNEAQINAYRKMFEGKDLKVVMGNISLKAFANPVNEVDFSHISGNIPLNESVELSVKDNEKIYYSVNDGAEQVYTKPISINETVKILATTDHLHYTSREYTPAKADFIDLGYFTSDEYSMNKDIIYAERQDAETYNIYLTGAENEISLFPISAADVYMNGELIVKNAFMDRIPLKYGLNTVEFLLKQENRLDNAITVNIYRNPVNIDLKTEKVKFENLTLTAPDGSVLKSGDSVADYTGLVLTAVTDDGENIEIPVPERAQVPEMEIDFYNETLNFMPNETAEYAQYAVVENPTEKSYISAEERLIDGRNITSGMVMNKAFRIIPGETVTIKIAPGNGMFGSEPVTYRIPSAENAPEESADYVSENEKYYLNYSDTLEYGIIGSPFNEAEFVSEADKFGYSTEEFEKLLMERYGIENHDELLILMGAKWDEIFELDADRKSGTKIAVRYYSGDQTFASKIRFDELKYIVKGDYNNDGAIDALDASLVLMYYADNSTGKSPKITDQERIAGDYNCDGTIDAFDASEILMYYAEMATSNLRNIK